MKQYALGRKLFGATFMLLGLTACIWLSGETPDCAWSGEAEAWVDENQNGMWDNEEKPLSGVQFVIDDIRNDYKNVGSKAISDEEGKAELTVWLPGCPTVEFEVSAKPPEGFQATTPDRVPASEDVLSFGFVSINGD